MIEAVNNKMFEQFISNFTNMMIQGNGDDSTLEIPREVKTTKAASIVGSVILSELKKIDKKQNQNERLLIY